MINETVKRYTDKATLVEGLIGDFNQGGGNPMYMRVGNDIAENMDSGNVTAAEVYTNMNERQRTNIKKAVDFYLSKNCHEGMSKLQQMLKRGDNNGYIRTN